jgi:hypothetical protein
MTTTRPAIRRRSAKPTPMRRLRIGAAARAGAVAQIAWPGIAIPEPEGGRRRLLATGSAAAVHALALGALFAVATLYPPPEKEQPIAVQLLKEPPPPPPKVEAKLEPTPAPAPAPIPKPHAEPAPAPKALAERRSVNFQPSAQAIAPQVVNPTVIARAAPTVAAPTLKLDAGSVTAPRDISRSAPAPIEAVQAVTSVAAARPTQFDVTAAAGPALRGPIQADAPAGPSVGPRPVTTGGDSVGTGPVKVGDGSSVREGVTSTRDVLGSPDGPRLADVNTRVGQSNLRGPGGEGTELGGATPDCQERGEVQAYLRQIKDRTVARWVPPADAPAGQVRATLRFQLDVGGSASRVDLVKAEDPRLGKSVVDALRSASPFPPMSERVRCLAGERLVGTFTLDSQKASVAN